MIATALYLVSYAIFVLSIIEMIADANRQLLNSTAV